MFDFYVSKYITDYLKLCKKCNKYDSYHYNKTCCFCKKFYCSKCEDQLHRNYNYYETTSNYCSICNIKCFEYPN